MKNFKKMIAPIIISLLLIIYYGVVAYFGVFSGDIPFLFKALIVVVPLGLIGVVVYVLFERFNEIRSGEEDDLSKY